MSRTTLHFQLLLLWYCKYFLTYQEPSSLSFRWQKFLWMNLFPWLSLYHLGILFCVFVPDQNPLKFWNYYYSLYRKLQLDDKPHPKQFAATATAKSLQSCLTLCNPIEGLLPGSSVPGILQARTLEWVAISLSNAWKWKVKSLSRVQLLATSWTADYQAPPSMGFSRQEYWSWVPLPSPTSIASLSYF